MIQRRPNLPKLAETEFQRLCDVHDIVRNKAYDDQTGWDYLLEIPRTPLARVAHDRQVGNVTARVQVKSKRSGRASTRLKLSNALHFAREPDVCFIVLFQYQHDGQACRVFVRHFDEALVAATLRKAREADRDGDDNLHRVFLPIHFTDEDGHTDDLLEWIAAVCDQSPQDYAARKQQWEQQLGYESVVARSTVTFDGEQLQAFIDSSVGLEGAVPVKHAVVQDVRFGIPGRHPIFEGPGSFIDIHVSPRPARLIVEGVDGPPVIFDGEFRFGLPVAEREMMRATFFAPCLKIVIKGLEDFDLTFNFDPSELYAVDLIDRMCRFRASRTGASVTLEVDCVKAVTMSCPPQPVPDNQRLDLIGLVATALLKATPAAGAIQLSMAQIHQSWSDAVDFTEMLSGGDMTLQYKFIELQCPMPTISNYVGHISVRIGSHDFWAVFRRPCLKQEIAENSAKLVFGDPIVLDGGVVPASDDGVQQMLEQRVADWAKRIGDGTLTLNEGNPRPSGPDDNLRMLVS